MSDNHSPSPKANKASIYPTFVIGLGGTGKNVVRHVKRRFANEWHDSVALSEQANDATSSLLQVLAVDTEPLVNQPNEEELYQHEYAFLGKFDGTKLISNKALHAPFLDWWTWNPTDIPLGYIHNGARQIRPVGRLAFFRNYVTFQRMIKRKREAMVKIPAIEQAEERGHKVISDTRLIFLVCSVCGGTGAGMILDAVHAVRHQFGTEARIIGLFVMPSVFDEEIQSDLQSKRIQANAYALLKEIDQCQRLSDFDALYPSEQGRIPDPHRRPFDRVFLVEMMDDNGQTLENKSSVEKSIAHFIHLTAFSGMSDTLLGRGANESEIVSSQGQSGFAYSGFGVSAMFLARQSLGKYFKYRATSHSLDMLTNYEADSKFVAGKIEEFRKNTYEYLQRGISSNDIKTVQAFTNSIKNGEKSWLQIRKILGNIVCTILATQGIPGVAKFLEKIKDVTTENSPNHWYNHAGWGIQNAEAPKDYRDESDIKRPHGYTFLPLGQKGAIDRQLEATRNLFQGYKLATERKDALLALLGKLNGTAESWLGGFNRLNRIVQTAIEESKNTLADIERNFNPREQNKMHTTAYDLETNVLGQDEIELVKKWAENALGMTLGIDNESQEAQSTIQYEIANLLMPENDEPRFDLDSAGIIAMTQALDVMQQWVTAAENKLDIREMMSLKLAGKRRRPNQRIDQWLRRSRPRVDIDRDNNNFAKANPEPTRLATTPGFEANQVSEKTLHDFAMLIAEQDEYAEKPVGSRDRVDACFVQHGLPIDHIKGIDKLYAQYWGNDFDQLTLHLEPEFAQWDEIYQPADAAKRQTQIDKKATLKQRSETLKKQNDSVKPQTTAADISQDTHSPTKGRDW